jgi:hypothetical protein
VVFVNIHARAILRAAVFQIIGHWQFPPLRPQENVRRATAFSAISRARRQIIDCGGWPAIRAARSASRAAMVTARNTVRERTALPLLAVSALAAPFHRGINGGPRR